MMACLFPSLFLLGAAPPPRYHLLAQATFSSNGEGTLTVIRELSPSRFEVVANVTTAPGARTLALDSRTHHVYVVTAQFGPPPAPTAEQPHPRPGIVPGTFEVQVYGE